MQWLTPAALAEGLSSLRSGWPTQQVPGQAELQNLPKNKQTKTHFERENEGKMRNACLQLVLHNNFLAAEIDSFGGRDAH